MRRGAYGKRLREAVTAHMGNDRIISVSRTKQNRSVYRIEELLETAEKAVKDSRSFQ